VSKIQSVGEGRMEGGCCRVIVAVRGEGRRCEVGRQCGNGVGGVVKVVWGAGDVTGPWDRDVAR
jgi:hypothetical protein